MEGLRTKSCLVKSMEAEEILQLLDSNWFQHGCFTCKHNHQESIVSAMSSRKFLKVSVQPRPTLQGQSYSYQGLIGSTSCCQDTTTSPNSAVEKQKLQKEFSGKEIIQFSNSQGDEEKQNSTKEKKRTRRRGMSRSLSELEFKELNGFMDLGFVFTEEDKTSSSLVSILPGLQRWGKVGEEETRCDEISRPYLSESWGDLNQKNPLMKWKIPAAGHDETSMKDQLRVWAQTVASSVKWS